MAAAGGVIWHMHLINGWHPVALSESLDVLHQAMHPVLYRCITMTIEIASDLPAFFIVVDSLLPTNIAK